MAPVKALHLKPQPECATRELGSTRLEPFTQRQLQASLQKMCATSGRATSGLYSAENVSGSGTHGELSVSRDNPLEAAEARTAQTWSATQLYTHYLDDVYRYVARRLAVREDAEDVTAEVFGAAFEALPRFRGAVEPRLWLLGIARRKVADALRRGRGRYTASWDDSGDESATQPLTAPRAHDPVRVLAQREAAATIRRVLASLKEEQREALLLKYVEDLSTEEIAVVLGRSVAAANSLLQRARATALRQGRAYFHDFLTEESPVSTQSAASAPLRS